MAAFGGRGSGDDRRWYGRWPVIAAVALLVVGGVTALFLTWEPARRVLPGPLRPSAEPPRERFEFPAPRVKVNTFTGRDARRAARRAAGNIGAILGRFYDAAFVDPRTWEEGVPGDLWQAFSRGSVAAARRDAAALTLGRREGLEELHVKRATLTVQVLVGPSNDPQAAVATVLFVATGATESGTGLDVRNEATLLLRQISGKWRVVGWPEARTTVEPSQPPAARPPGASPGSAGKGGKS